MTTIDRTKNCGACYRYDHPNECNMITDDAVECDGCGWIGSGSYMHSCRGRTECGTCVRVPLIDGAKDG